MLHNCYNMVNETERHKLLKQKAVEFLKNKGHKNIIVEYRLTLKTNANDGNYNWVGYDVVALDEPKTVIEVGNLDGQYSGADKKKIAEENGFKYLSWEYGKVIRLPVEIYIKLLKINEDINSALNYLINVQKPIKQHYLAEEEIQNMIDMSISQAKSGGY